MATVSEEKVRATIRLPASLVEEVRDAVAYLWDATDGQVTFASFAEEALRHHLDDQKKLYLFGQPFPKLPREPKPDHCPTCGHPVG